METLIDSSLWVDYFRPKTPVLIKQQVIPFIDSPSAVLCEPVRFEILRAAQRAERTLIENAFATLPLLPNPAGLWLQATRLGQRCVDVGVNAHSLDLLIAAICNHFNIALVTFDRQLAEVSRVCSLKVNLLARAVP